MLARYLPQEGSTTHIYTLAKGLIAHGHEVAIASAGHNGSESAISIYERSIADGVQHIRLPFPMSPSFGVSGKLIQAATYLLGAPVMLSRIARWNPDVIHVHYPVTSFLAAIYRRVSRTRFVTTHHISGIPKHPLHRKADVAVAISSELRHELTDNFGYAGEDVALVFNGIDIDRFRYLKDSDRNEILGALGLEGASNKTIVGFIGTISHRKGLDLLLRAVSELDQSQFQVVIVGDGELEWLKGLIAEAGLEESVSVFNFSDPEPFYSIFDVFVLPSRQEGFGLVAIEAMASRVLTVRSNVEGATDQITNGVTGYLFESENVDQFRFILGNAIQRNGEYDAVAFAGQEFAIERFSVHGMVDRVERIYERLMGSK